VFTLPARRGGPAPALSGSLEAPLTGLALLPLHFFLFPSLRQQLSSLLIVAHFFSNGTSQPFPFQGLPHSSFALLLNRLEQFLWNQTVPHSFPLQRGYTPFC